MGDIDPCLLNKYNPPSPQIVCETGAKAVLSNKDGVEVRISEGLVDNPDNHTMTYMDKWSSIYTWGGSEENKPVEGDLAVLTEGTWLP